MKGLKIIVQCSDCKLSYEKRKDTMKNWSGLCENCHKKTDNYKGRNKKLVHEL